MHVTVNKQPVFIKLRAKFIEIGNRKTIQIDGKLVLSKKTKTDNSERPTKRRGSMPSDPTEAESVIMKHCEPKFKQFG